MDFIKQLFRIPDTSGIYLFFNAKKECVYVGKATSLKSRVRSYFPSLPLPTSPSGRGRGIVSRPIEQMMHEITSIRWKETDSVLEAIILEANEIKRIQPKYNVEGKDDKSWNYIVITNDPYPAVQTIRQHEIQAKYGISDLGFQISDLRRDINLQSAFYNLKYLFGPFPGLNMREMMKMLRRLFFVSDCATKRAKHGKQSMQSKQNKHLYTMRNLPNLLTLPIAPTAKPCLYYQMGQCLGVCTGEITSSEYRKKVIRPLVSFLRGGKKQVIASLEKEMNRASKEERFEEAGRLRNQIAGLRRVQDVALLNKSFVSDLTTDYGLRTSDLGYRTEKKKMAVVRGPLSVVHRIEGCDISNLGSSGKVGSMVVFDQHGPVKLEYRKFKIKTVEGQSDVDCLKEILQRRLRHANIRITNGANIRISDNKKDFWPLPDVILVDGGKPQVNVAKKVLEEFGMSIPVVGIAKGPERKRNDIIYVRNTRSTSSGQAPDAKYTKEHNEERLFIRWLATHKSFLIQVRDEAHRFAIGYQRKLRELK